MPADGAQHNNPPANPFEEVKPRISEYTAKEIALLQGRLQQQLGPEFISTRKGPGGKNVHYIASDKVIGLANDVFGFNGWSSTIKDIQVDFVDENMQTRRVDVGLSVVVRVTLRDGTFHEDIGYGHIENCSGKAAAFEKAKKEGTTDALKRTLRNFGNVLGNCVYDKDYLAKVTKIRVKPTRFSEDNLHRHADFAPAKQEEGSGGSADRSPNEEMAAQATGGDSLPSNNASKESAAQDDFVSVDFDEADFSFSEFDSPDSVMADVKPALAPAQASAQTPAQSRPNVPPQAASRAAASFPAGRANPPHPGRPSHPPSNANSRPAQLSAHAQSPSHGQGQRPGVNPANQGGSFRPGQARPGPSPAAAHNLSRPAHSTSAVPHSAQNQHSTGAQQNNGPSARPVSVPPQGQGQGPAPPPPPSEGPIPPGAPRGFVTSRDAVTAQSAAAPVPAFNPKAESPSIRRTAGFDHTKTACVKRVSVPWTSPAGNQLPALPPPLPGAAQSDMSRRVGAPLPHNSPLANRNQFKPVGKRPADAELQNNQSAGSNPNSNATARPALSDVTAGAVNTAGSNASSGPPDAKKPKLEGGQQNGPGPTTSGNNPTAK